VSIAKYYPFNGERGRLRLGLTSIDCSEWIQYEDDFTERLIQKSKLIKELGREVLDALPSSNATQKEFLKLLLEHIQLHHRDTFTVSENGVLNRINKKFYSIDNFSNNPLELVSYLAADDFCLLEEDGGDYKLVAASVCAPTWWSLQEKMGEPLVSIHKPILNLEEKIGRMIRHFLKNLKVNECYQRSNWFLFASKELCVFPNSFDFYSEMNGIDEGNIETSLYLRSERQTFRKLKNSNAIVFGIKVYVEPISVVKDHPAIAEDLTVALNTMNEEQKQGLGITYVEKPLKKYLSSVVSD